METITNLLRDRSNELMTFGVRRIKYEPYKMGFALDVVNRIGKGIIPEFNMTDELIEVYKQLIMYFHADNNFNGNLEKGLMLMGPTGTGKTLAMEIMRIYRQIDDTKFIITNKIYRMNFDIISVNRLVAAYLNDGYDGLDIYCSRYFICLDDVGIETDQVKYYGNTLDVIGHVLTERYSKRYLTLATTNYPIEILENKYDDRIISRMYALFNFIEMAGIDYRKLKKQTV